MRSEDRGEKRLMLSTIFIGGRKFAAQGVVLIAALFAAAFTSVLFETAAGCAGAEAQTQIHISGPQSGFPIAVPQLCDSGGSADVARKIPEVIGKDLELSAVFKVINPGAFVETPGKCSGAKNVAFSDWSVIGAEWLVKGTITSDGSTFNAELYLFDVPQQTAVLAKA